MSSDDKIILALVGTVVMLIGVLFALDQLDAARYYDCIYTIKSAGLSPADLLVLCER